MKNSFLWIKIIPQTVALIFILCIFIAGCNSSTPLSSPEKSLHPDIFVGEFFHNLQYGKSSNIKISKNTGLNNWNKDISFSLTPAGPYVSHNYGLDAYPLAIEANDHYAYVATRSDKPEHSDLIIIKFSEEGGSKKVTEVSNIKGEITKLIFIKSFLMVSIKNGGLLIFDLSDPDVPVLKNSYQTKSTVLDIQSSNKSVYLLLENKTLHKLNLPAENQNTIHGIEPRKWNLPVAGQSFAIQDQFVFTAGKQGIASVKLTETSADLISLRKTSGTPLQIQIMDDLALLADGTGGLVVFRVDQNQNLQWLGSYRKRGPVNKLHAQKSATGDFALVTLENGSLITINLTNPELPDSGIAFKTKHPVLAATISNKLPNKLDNHKESTVLAVTENELLKIVLTGDNRQLISSEGVMQGGSRRGIIRENILYVADWFSGLHLYDISNPKHIQHLSNFHTPGSSKGVSLLGDYALVGDDDRGLQIINIKNKNNPQWISELTPASLANVGLAYTMKLVNKTLYLADHRGGFHIIDLSDIYHPKRLGGYNTPGKSWGIDVSTNFAFVADDTAGLLIFDVNKKNQTKLIGQFNPDGQAEDVKIKDKFAYVTFFDKGLYILDIQQPHKPVVVGHLPIPGNARGLMIENDIVYVAGWESGLHIVNVSNPQNPRIIGNYDTEGAAWGINIKNGLAFVLDWWGGISVIDVKQQTHPTFVSQYHARSQIRQVRAFKKYLYAATGESGLQVYDIKNPLNPIWTTGLDFQGIAQDIWIDNDRAYVAAGTNGVLLVDIHDPNYSRLIKRVDTPGNASLVRAWKNILYIQDSQAGLFIVDVSDPQNPLEVTRLPLQITDLWIDENALWIYSQQGLIRWLHDGKGTLTDKTIFKQAAGGYWVRSNQSLLITASDNGAINIWKHKFGDLHLISQHNVSEPVTDLHLVDNTIYILGKQSGLMAIDVNDSELPRLSTVYPATGLHTQFTVTQNAALFAGDRRLASVKILPPTSISGGPDKKTIHIPADMPQGQYHILATSPTGHQELLPNAINIELSISKKGKSSLENMRQMLKTPLKKPAEGM